MSRGGEVANGACDTQATAELFRALAHPMRLQILYRLLDSEVSVAGLETELGLRQPNLSQQLGHLREAKLVTTRRKAKSIFYSLTDRRVRVIVEALSQAPGDTPLPLGGTENMHKIAVPIVEPEAPRADKLRPSSRTLQTSECGVFAVVGWAASDRTLRRDGARGTDIPTRQP